MKKANKTTKEILQARVYLSKGDASIDFALEGKSVQERRDSLARIVDAQKRNNQSC